PASSSSTWNGPSRVSVATSTRNRARGKPLASSTICFSAPERSSVGINCNTLSTASYPSMFQDRLEQRQVPARDGGDRELLHDPAASRAAHVKGAVEVLPLLDDHAGQCPRILRRRQPAVLEVADQAAVARDRRGDQRDPQSHRLQQGDAHSLFLRG